MPPRHLVVLQLLRIAWDEALARPWILFVAAQSHYLEGSTTKSTHGKRSRQQTEQHRKLTYIVPSAVKCNKHIEPPPRPPRASRGTHFLELFSAAPPARRGARRDSAMAARYIENEIRDFTVGPKKERKGSKGRKANGVEDAILHSALRLSLQRILRETPPSEATKSRDFSVYTGADRKRRSTQVARGVFLASPFGCDSYDAYYCREQQLIPVCETGRAFSRLV